MKIVNTRLYVSSDGSLTPAGSGQGMYLAVYEGSEITDGKAGGYEIPSQYITETGAPKFSSPENKALTPDLNK
jgi:hypothetical protein